MEFTAKQIAQLVNGKVVGDENAKVHTFTKIEEGKEGAISFLASEKYVQYIYNTRSTIVLVDSSIHLQQPVHPTIIQVENARDCVARLLQLYTASQSKKKGIDERAYVSPTATIGKDCWIGAFAYVGENVVVGDGCQIYPNVTICDGVTVGDNCTFYPQVTIYHDCKVGQRVILHAGCVVGADGFGFAPNGECYDKIPQIGNVVIEDDVEIGANSCVDRATMGSTYVRRGVKLDNLVQIAHNTDIGAHTVMSAQVGVAGSTKVGQWCMFGGQVGISGHITIGDKVMLGAQSGVPTSLESNQQLIGTPPMRQMTFFRSQALLQRLPEMNRELLTLKKELEQLKKQK